MNSQGNQDLPVKSLFPAYSSSVNENPVYTKDDEKEWLCNNSFTVANYEAALLQHKIQEPIQEVEECVTVKDDSASKLVKKRKKIREDDKKHLSKEALNLTEESNSFRSQLQKLTFIEETGLSHERAYCTDKKWDAENRLFECFERKHIAKYKLKFQVPYGLSFKEQNSWPQPTEKKVDKPIRYFNKKGLKLLSKLETNGNEIQIISLPSNYVLDFIPILSSNDDTKSEHKFLSPNFYGVSIDWKSGAQKKSLKTADSEECFSQVSALEKEMREKTISFNKQLSDDPHNIRMWLDFIDFQDEMFKSQSDATSNKLSDSHVVEKKVAILEKAISQNPNSVDLIVMKLNLCRDLWKLEELTASWENLLFLNPNNPQVWQQYLVFVLMNLKYFNTQRVLKLYTKCIRTLSNISEGIIQSHKSPPDIIHSMIEIFSQFCYVLQSCGYTERAIASYQALIEFNFFPPPFAQSLSVSERITCFEPFWDSGALRFAEDGAIGWASTVTEKKIVSETIVSESDLNSLEDEILCQKSPLWKTWYEFEKLRENHHWLPWRPNPEYDQTSDDVDDVDRTISFDDVSSVLFMVSNENDKLFLLLKFLNFLGYNIHEFTCTDNENRYIHAQVHLDNIFLFRMLEDNLFRKQMLNPFSLKQVPLNREKFNFITNVFSQSIENVSPENKSVLSLLWLKFQKHYALSSQNDSSFLQNVDNLKTFAKSMLQRTENRNCLLLWLEFIEIERLSNAKSKTNKTFQKLLVSSSDAVINGTMRYEDIWFFIRSYVEWCIGFHKHDDNRTIQTSHEEIIWLLLQIGNKEKYVPCSKPDNKPVLILKAAKGFKNLLDQHLTSLFSENPALCACLDPYCYSALDCLMCFAYFHYLTQGLDAALTVFNNTSELLESKLNGSRKRSILEYLSVLQAELLNFHTWNMTSAPIKPLMLYLYKAVEKYPYNARLLFLLVKLRCASSVVSPTRRFFYRLLKNSQLLSPTTWIFAIASELSIVYSLLEPCNEEIAKDVNVSTWGINWKIRALYEKALQSPLCSHIPSLWRSYIKFEIQCGDTVKAKGIFHRALQNCVWSKELHMDAISFFPEDLNQILDLMSEKQIRIHTPLEEVALLIEHAT